MRRYAIEVTDHTGVKHIGDSYDTREFCQHVVDDLNRSFNAEGYTYRVKEIEVVP